MPVWLLTLISLGPIVVPLARRVLFALGFGLVTYAGTSALLSTLKAQVITHIGESSESILALLQIANVDVAITTVFSAYGIKLGMMGVNAAGNLIRPRWRFTE